MIYIAVDHIDPKTNRAMPNGIAQHLHDQIGIMDGHRLDYPRILYYLKDCRIPRRVVNTIDAPVGSWYPLVLGWFNFQEDYLSLISPAAYDRIKRKQMKLIFTYHEGDHPGRIRKRINELCQSHGIDPDMVWFISGNSSANQYHNSIYWPELEFMYRRTVNLNNASVYHLNNRSKKYTALCRIDKLWRKVFMSSLWEEKLHQSAYFSYNQYSLGSEDDYYDCALDNDYLENCQDRVNRFIDAGPFKVDFLTTEEHNSYDKNMEEFYNDSYFNVVLETMIDVDGSGGQFVTEKTFKPIFNNQFFIVVSAAGHLAHLRDLGYKTFNCCIDEHYDTINNNQERFESVLSLTKHLASSSLEDLHKIYQKLQPEIQYNHQLFVSGCCHRLKKVIETINF